MSNILVNLFEMYDRLQNADGLFGCIGKMTMNEGLTLSPSPEDELLIEVCWTMLFWGEGRV